LLSELLSISGPSFSKQLKYTFLETHKVTTRNRYIP
jgi:hypothetical protein